MTWAVALDFGAGALLPKDFCSACRVDAFDSSPLNSSTSGEVSNQVDTHRIVNSLANCLFRIGRKPSYACVRSFTRYNGRAKLA